MEKQRSPMGLLRVPLGHWVIAAILAAAVAWGVRSWLEHNAVRSAETATLSWDAGAARRLDPDLANAAEPAVVLAQSILSDSVVAGLAHSASLPSLTIKTRIGEFRSRLELRQSSASLLLVQFRDANPERAGQAANAVARTLVAGPPPAAGAPAAVAPPPVKEPSVAPVKTPAPKPASNAETSLAHGLDQLEAQLSATRQKVDSLNSATWERRVHAGEPSSYRESKEQQLLTAEVGAALKQVADLRAEPTNGAAVQAALLRIQEALLSVWPASRAERRSISAAGNRGFNAAGIDADRLRQERAQFAHVLEVVQREQQAVQRLEPIEAAQPPASAPSGSASAAAASGSSPSSQAGVTPAIAESEIPKHTSEEPFRLVRPAGSPPRTPLWPAVLAGLGCGTFYLATVGLRYKSDEEEDDYEDEGGEESHRLITPARPLRPAEFFASAEPPPPEVVLPPPLIEKPDPPADPRAERSSEVIDQEMHMDAQGINRPFREEVIAEEGEADPWIDNMMKTLSETSIGKMFEKPPAQGREQDSAAEADKRPLSIHPDRLAG